MNTDEYLYVHLLFCNSLIQIVLKTPLGKTYLKIDHIDEIYMTCNQNTTENALDNFQKILFKIKIQFDHSRQMIKLDDAEQLIRLR